MDTTSLARAIAKAVGPWRREAPTLGICRAEADEMSSAFDHDDFKHAAMIEQTTRELALTPAYACSKGERNKSEARFSELKSRVGLHRVRWRRLWNVSEQFYLAATAQNLKRLVRLLAQRESAPLPRSA
jgi:IS5 family transposase